jgi:hypothetical protein
VALFIDELINTPYKVSDITSQNKQGTQELAPDLITSRNKQGSQELEFHIQDMFSGTTYTVLCPLRPPPVSCKSSQINKYFKGGMKVTAKLFNQSSICCWEEKELLRGCRCQILRPQGTVPFVPARIFDPK